MKFMKSNIKYVLAALSFTFFFSSCIKDDVEKLGDKGTPFVSFQEGPERVQYISAFEGDKMVDLFTIIRDEVSSAAVNQAVTVTITESAAGLDNFNEENETEYEPIAESSFTLVSDAIQALGGGQYKVTFAPGVTNVPFTIKINSGTWDFEGTHALFFTLSDANGKKVKSGKGEIMSAVAIMNKYDGVYEVTGTMVDVTNATWSNASQTLNGVYDEPYLLELRTTGPNTCSVFDVQVFGDYIIPFSTDNGTGLSGFGSFALGLEFDPATDKIVSVTNLYGQPASNTRAAGLDPTGENAYNAGNKTIKIKYFMSQKSVIPDPPHIRANWDETWKYVGAR